MLNRPQFEDIYMRLAFDLSSRSSCARLQVGCVVVAKDYTRIYGIGYNGNASGLENSCDAATAGSCGCLHAEENALLKTNVGPEIPKIVFTTHQPCLYCAKRFVNKGGVETVYFSEPYRLNDGINILERVGVRVIQHKLGPSFFDNIRNF